MAIWSVQSKFVNAQVQSLGAMLGPAWFNIGVRTVQPFAVAPWADDSGPRYQKLPNILKRLRGEWACVPFGIETNCRPLPRDWRSNGDVAAGDERFPHGRSSNSEWQLAGLWRDSVSLVLHYPEPHPVKLLRRTIRASGTQPMLHISLAIEVRESCDLPLGVHPTFRLPMTPRQAILMLEEGAQAWTSPIPLEPAIARFVSDARGVPLDRIPLSNGGAEDVTRLPLPYAAEEIVLATGVAGSAALRNLEEQYTVALSWDSRIFPTCQLWLSNGGRSEYPWSSRFRALAIEPIRAAFDLGTRVSQDRQNPLWRAGLPCTVSLSPNEPFETTYDIGVS